MQKSLPSIVALISGRGSNLAAILDYAKHTGAYKTAAVISNRPGAEGLKLAESQGVHTEVLDHTVFASRDEFDKALKQRIDAHAPDLVVLAGFMRVLTPAFVKAFEGRLVNIHPSLLPSFPGLKTHQQALEAGVRVHGATVHLVTAELDHGPILDQAVVRVREVDTAETLAARVLALEHQIYPRAIAALLHQTIRQTDGQVHGALAAPLAYDIE